MSSDHNANLVQAAAQPHMLIQAEGLGKRYELFDKPADRLKQLVWGRWHNYGRSFWALQDVSFSVARGEVVGLVGRNGAGKSTLLQMVCGTVQPTVGKLTVNGRIAALLELGAGFNPDFSGIENVYLNAALLGLSHAEVDAKLDGILAFADIGAFVHQPVKTYSSGMFVRLAFAVATSLDPEILVIDEALSVGDGAFARKSFERVMQMRERGAAVLFCSHSMYHIQALCTRALWLEGGHVRQYDTAAKVTSAYETALVAESAHRVNEDNKSIAGGTSLESDGGQKGLKFTGLSAESVFAVDEGAMGAAGHTEETGRIVSIDAWTDDGQQGRELAVQSGHTSVHVRVRFASNPALPAPAVAFGLAHLSGVTISSGISLRHSHVFARDAAGRGTAHLTLSAMPLLQGDYFLTIFLACENGLQVYEFVERAVTLRVSQTGLEQGLVVMPQQWQDDIMAPGAVGVGA
jgi:lipopolysaccharide transport system ATP-binding protein